MSLFMSILYSRFLITRKVRLDNQFRLINEVSNNDEAFIKLKKYSDQNEYRLVWFTGKNPTDHIIIKCPEAIQFCERIEF